MARRVWREKGRFWHQCHVAIIQYVSAASPMIGFSARPGELFQSRPHPEYRSRLQGEEGGGKGRRGEKRLGKEGKRGGAREKEGR